MQSPAHVSGNGIENRYGQIGGGRVAVLTGNARTQSQAWGRLTKALGQLADAFRRHAHDVRHVLGRIGVDDVDVGARACATPRDDVGHRERDQGLATRLDRQPLVGVLSREREPRPDEHEPPFVPSLTDPTHPGECPSIPNRGQPTLEKVGPEGNQEPGFGQVIGGNDVASERDPARLAKWRLGKRIVTDDLASGDSREVREEIGHGRTGTTRDQEMPVGRAKPVGEHLLRILPRDGLKSPVLPRHGPRIAVWIVQPLKARVAAGTQSASRDGMVGVTLDLHDPALSGPHPHPARGLALRASRGIPSGNARRDVFRRNHIGHQVLHLFRGTAQHASSGTTDAHYLQKFSSL